MNRRPHPCHVAVIPDGGRRWARRTRTPLADAYRLSFRRLEELIRVLHAAGCQEVSVYCLSKANLSRSESEIASVFDAFDALSQTLRNLKSSRICGPVRAIGSPSLLPERARVMILEMETAAAPDGACALNLLVAYDAWDELRDAVSRCGAEVSVGDLSVSRPIDAIIRSGGGILLSGLLPLQSQYAQLIVTNRLFNDLAPDDFTELADRACAIVHQFGL